MTIRIGRRSLLIMGVSSIAGGTVLGAGAADAARGGSPTVKITGPITSGSRGNAFGAATMDLASEGYEEAEYFLEGEARAYEPAPGTLLGKDGRWTLRPAGAAPFKTRILVARPKRAADFSGNVILRWQNVSAGFEISPLLRRDLKTGDAYVAVSAQRVSLDGYPGAERFAMRGWDPARYGGLHHPGDDFSYDIYTQAARGVGPDRGRLAVDPMAGLKVKRVFAMGGSQSAIRLTSYLNGVQPLEHALHGAQISVGFGSAAPITSRPGDPPMQRFQSRIRDDLGIPVMLLTTETEAEGLYPMRQPDTAFFRTWEIAGAAHAGSSGGRGEIVALFKRDGMPMVPGLDGKNEGPGPQPNSLSFAPVVAASWAYLKRWADGGPPPPSFPLIEFSGDPPHIVRDEHGNARGGLRMPELEAPTATYRGMNETPGGSGLGGTTTPFPPEELRRLYRNRADYLAKYGAAVQRGVEAGYILKQDAPDMIAAADEKWGPLIGQ